jgi:hypothetical protein
MTKEAALTLLVELRDMVGDGPGPWPGAEERLRKIAVAFRGCETTTAYFQEKAGEAVEQLRIWRSARRWQKLDEGQLRSRVNNSLSQLESVIRDPGHSGWSE